MRFPPVLQPLTPLTSEERDRLALMSREMTLYAKLQGESTQLVRARARLEPGTPAFIDTAKRDYAELIEQQGAVRLPKSFTVSAPPPAVDRVVHAFTRVHQGALEVGLNTIDGHRTYQAHVLQQRGKAQVLLVDVKGTELARGIVTGTDVKWHW